MKIPDNSILFIRPVNNYVIVEPIVRTDEIVYKSLKLYFDNTMHREKHVPVVCQVVSVCSKLIYDPELIPHEKTVFDPAKRKWHTDVSWDQRCPESMPWKTEKLVKRGDLVWVNYYPIIRAMDDNDGTKIIYSDDKKYFMVHYSDIYCIKRKKEVIMLNGYCLVEPLEDEDTETMTRLKKLGLVPPVEEKDRPDRFGIIRYMGKPNETYEDSVELGEDCDIFRINDVVRFQRDYNRHLEQSDHHHWFDGKTYICVQRRYLAAIVKLLEN